MAKLSSGNLCACRFCICSHECKLADSAGPRQPKFPSSAICANLFGTVRLQGWLTSTRYPLDADHKFPMVAKVQPHWLPQAMPKRAAPTAAHPAVGSVGCTRDLFSKRFQPARVAFQHLLCRLPLGLHLLHHGRRRQLSLLLPLTACMCRRVCALLVCQEPAGTLGCHCKRGRQVILIAIAVVGCTCLASRQVASQQHAGAQSGNARRMRLAPSRS